MIKVGNKRIEKWSKMERFLVPKQMGRFLGNSPTGNLNCIREILIHVDILTLIQPLFFVLKVLSALYVCCKYSCALQTRFYIRILL